VLCLGDLSPPKPLPRGDGTVRKTVVSSNALKS